MAVDFAKPTHHDDAHWNDEDDIFCPHDHLESGGGPDCPHCVDDEMLAGVSMRASGGHGGSARTAVMSPNMTRAVARRQRISLPALCRI